MGLKWSAEKILGWRTRWASVQRWRDRCVACFEDGRCANDQDFVDFFLAFMMLCYSLRDFTIHSGGVSKDDIDPRIGKCDAMRLCRDICNRAKHHTLDKKPSIDADWSLGREYIPWSNGHHKWFVVADGKKYDPLDLVSGCIRFWEELIVLRKFVEPPNPFPGGQP